MNVVDADSADDVLDESSSSDNEAEWVPSSWDSLAKPARSALKSPDKSSSVSILCFRILYKMLFVYCGKVKVYPLLFTHFIQITHFKT